MRQHLQLSARLGFYAACTAVFVSLIGMVETFGEREVISGVISLGHTLLVVNALFFGYLTASSGRKALNPPGSESKELPASYALLGGTLSGILIGFGLLLLVWITANYNIREVLVNASPTLVELLTFGRGVSGSALLLILASGAFCLTGSILFILPGRIRKPLTWGMTVVIIAGMLGDLLRITLTRPGWPTTLSKFLISGQGLAIKGAVAIFIVTVVLTIVWRWIPILYRRNLDSIVTWTPVWLRTSTFVLVSVMLVLRLLWFIGVDTKDLSFRPDCEDGASIGECLSNVGIGLREIGRVESFGLPDLAPFVQALITTFDSLALLAVLLVGLVTIVGVIRNYGAPESERAARTLPPARLEQAARFASLYILAAVLLFMPLIVGVFPSEVLVNIGLFVMMGFGINIVVGFAGLLDLGYVAFFSVGAYTTALLTSTNSVLGWELTFWGALPIVFVVTAFTGLLVGAPVLRMRGDYLAIVTLGLGEIARFLALSDWLRPWLGGAQGILNIPHPIIAGIEIKGPQKLYYLLLFGSMAALFVSWRLQDSRVGRALIAMREDEDVADAMGVNTVYYKLLAFAMGASIASFSGAIFAAKLGAIFPHSFNVIVSITALSLLIIGGIGSLPGVIAGAFALVGLPELLREFTEYRLMLYGAALVIMMIVRPEGLIPARGRQVDIKIDDRDQDAWLKKAQQKSEEELAASGAD